MVRRAVRQPLADANQLENGAACAPTSMGATGIRIACRAYARSSYNALTWLARASVHVERWRGALDDLFRDQRPPRCSSDALNQCCAFAHTRANKLCNPALLAIKYALGNAAALLGHVQAERSLVFSPDYLAEPLTPDPLPTKDSGVLRTYLERPMSLPVKLCEHIAQDCLQAVEGTKDPRRVSYFSGTRWSGCRMR